MQFDKPLNLIQLVHRKPTRPRQFDRIDPELGLTPLASNVDILISGIRSSRDRTHRSISIRSVSATRCIVSDDTSPQAGPTSRSFEIARMASHNT